MMRSIIARGFERGSGQYKCRFCHKQTRATDRDAANVGSCARCYDMAGDENAVLDGQMTQAEFDAKWNAPEEKKIEKIPAGLRVEYKNWKTGTTYRGIVVTWGRKWVEVVREGDGKQDWGTPSSTVAV